MGEVQMSPKRAGVVYSVKQKAKTGMNTFFANK